MRKIYAYLFLTFTFLSCDNKEELTSKSQSGKKPTQTYIINGDIEYTSEITDGSKPKKSIFIYDIPKEIKENETTKKISSKTSEQTVTINFGYSTGSSTNSGCTIKRYNNGNSYYTDAGVYGSNPYPYPSPEVPLYLVRGYGVPHLNLYYGSLVLFVENKKVQFQTRREVINDNQPNGSAISIEYPFKANISYEISIKVTFHDNIYLVDKIYSDGFPTLYAQLKDDGIIHARSYKTQTQDPCDKEGVISLDEYAIDYQNNTRSYTLESRAVIERNLIFKFSPTKEKKALLISLHPATSKSGYGATIRKNNYTMRMPSVTITEKPFDPSLNIDPIINTDNSSGGRR